MPAIEVADKKEDRQYVRVPIVKGTRKGDPAWVEVDLNDLPEDVLKEVYLQGCKTLLNRGMSKITGTKTDQSVAEVMKIAAQNLQDMYDGKVRMSAGIRTKISGAEKTEAMRIARAIIKDGIKDNGGKISHYSPKDISAAAAELLESDDGKEIMAQAKAAVEARAKEKSKAKESIGAIVAGMTADPELVKKAEEAAAKRKKPTGDEAKANLAAAAQAGLKGRQQGQHQNR